MTEKTQGTNSAPFVAADSIHDIYHVEEALRQATANGGLDLILLDIKMLKILTAKCAELGVADFLRKPFKSKDLVKRIRRVLERRQWQWLRK